MNTSLFKNEPEPIAVPAGSAVFSQGDRGDCMYAVISGEVEMVRDGATLDVVPEGGIFGERALLAGSPRSASAVAKSDSRVAKVSAQPFMTIVSQNPPFAI